MFFLYLFLISILFKLYHYSYESFIFLSDFLELIVSFSIMFISMYTYRMSQNKMLTFLGISLGCFGFTELISILCNKSSMPAYTLNNYVYLQIFGDYLKIFSILLFCKLYDKPKKFSFIVLYNFLFMLVFILLLFVFEVFPPVSYILFLDISVLRLANFVVFIFSLYLTFVVIRNRLIFSQSDMKLSVFMSIFLNISTLLFTLNSSSTGILGFFAHITLIAYLLFLWKFFIVGTLFDPYNVLFGNLNQKSKELLKSKLLYEKLVKSLPVSVLIVKDDIILFANSNCNSSFKYSEHYDLEGKEINKLIYDDYIESFIENINLHKKHFKTKLKQLDGNIFDAEISSMPINFDNSACKLVLVKDISGKLEVDKLNRKLKKKILESKVQSEFFSNFSHELRSPINDIYSTLQLKEIYIKRKDFDSIEKYNNLLKQNCLKLLKMCNNLIDITRIRSRHFKANMQTINIVDVIDNIVYHSSSYAQNSKMNIVFDTYDEEICILCDKKLIERIFLNLISNSLKHGNEGTTIYIDIFDKQDNVSILFKDDCSNFHKHKDAQVFNKLVQPRDSFTKSKKRGGLNLSIVKELVELLNGNINLISTQNRGYSLEIMFPKTFDKCYNYENFTIDDDLKESIRIEFSDI